MKNIEHLLKWTCPLCGDQVHPIMGATFIKDELGWRYRCLACEPPKGRQ